MGATVDKREVAKVRSYVTGAEASVIKLEMFPRTLARYPFDHVGLAAMSKAFALAKACLKLLVSGWADEAYGLSRSLVECAINLRYLTQEPDRLDERTYRFIHFFWADKAYWLENALRQFTGKSEEQQIRQYAKALGIAPDPKSALRHWSGKSGFSWTVISDPHPLDGAQVTPLFKKASYAIDYHQTSSFVHCAQPALDNYVVKTDTAFRVSRSSGQFENPGQSTLFIVLHYLHSAIAYVLFGLKARRPARLDSLFENTLARMKPIPRKR